MKCQSGGPNARYIKRRRVTLTTVVTCDEYAEADLRYNDTRFLPDGLIVLGGSDTKRFVANWHVLITIAIPTAISGMRQKLPRFKTILNNLRSVHEVANATSDAWNLRIVEIEDNVYSPQSPVHRERRGLLDVFGELSKTFVWNSH